MFIRISWLMEPLYLFSPRSNCRPCPKTMSLAQVCLLVSFCLLLLLSFPSAVAAAPPCCLPTSPAAVADAVVDAVRLFCCHCCCCRCSCHLLSSSIACCHHPSPLLPLSLTALLLPFLMPSCHYLSHSHWPDPADNECTTCEMFLFCS